MFFKAKRVTHKLYKGIALAIVVAGFGYTLYHLGTTVGAVMTDDRFHFEIMIITVIVLFFASIAMAFGEPEK
jgi:membrane protein DedA with SNARE-associated domain